MRPKALVLSDLPIVGATINAVLRDSFDVKVRKWRNYLRTPMTDQALVILDVTAIGRDTALTLLSHSLGNAVVVVFTLHANEVELYRLDRKELSEPCILPSLLALRDSQLLQAV